MEILFNIIVATAILCGAFGWLTISCAWEHGGEFYIKGNKGRRKMWVERLLDGFEVLRKM